MVCTQTCLPTILSVSTLKTGEFSTAEGMILKESRGDIFDAPLSEPFLTRIEELLTRPDGFMLYSILGVPLFSISELLEPNMRVWLQLHKARPNFHLVCDNSKNSPGFDDCSHYTRRIAVKDNCHKKMNGHACIFFSGVELFGDFSRNFCRCCQTNRVQTKNNVLTMLQVVRLQLE